MSEFGIKIKNIEAATLYEYNKGLRDRYDYKDAMFVNSLFKDFICENKLKLRKDGSTRDLICLEFNFGTRTYEQEIEHIRKIAKKARLDYKKAISFKSEKLIETQKNKKHKIMELYNFAKEHKYLYSSISADEEDPFAFCEKYKTGVELIDTEHRRLFEIIHDTNDLIHAELLHDKYDEIMHLLGELKDYTEFHFRDEENLMERIHYPEISAQKRAHTAFVERLVEVDLTDLDEMDDNQQEYLIDLINFLSGWLINHILGSDKKIGEYMREHGIKEE